MFDPYKNMVGGFSENDGTIDFYLRINHLIDDKSIVLDLGAGRGAWYLDEKSETRRQLQYLVGKVKKVIAADVDTAVLSNTSSDHQLIIKNDLIDLPSSSVDLIISDYVLEHISDPQAFFYEIERVLKPGGWFCARTPHKYSYIAIISNIIKSRYHSRILKFAQPARKEIDVFQTCYRLNTFFELRRVFSGWQDHSFIFRSDPDYYFGSKLLFYVQKFFNQMMPAFFNGNLFVFKKKV